jgi:hypothetical protein
MSIASGARLAREQTALQFRSVAERKRNTFALSNASWESRSRSILNTITIARNPCVPPPLLQKVSEAIEEAEEDEAVVVAVSEAAVASEAVAIVEAEEAVAGTSRGLAEELVVAEGARIKAIRERDRSLFTMSRA